MSLLSPALQAFLAIAKHKTVHGAANTLFLTQTAVTQRIKTLEQSLGTTLFTRTRRGMALTTEGEALLRYCLAAKDLEGQALASIQGAGTHTTTQISITGPTSLMRARIPHQCIQVMERFPQLLMEFNINDIEEERIQLLKRGGAQFAIISKDNATREMKTKALEPENYLLVCSAKWKDMPLKTILSTKYIVDYNKADTMTFNYLKQFNLFEYASHERHFANRTETLAMMITQGYGYGVLSEEFCKPYLKDKTLMVLNHGKSYCYHVVLAFYERPSAPDYFQQLIDVIR